MPRFIITRIESCSGCERWDHDTRNCSHTETIGKYVDDPSKIPDWCKLPDPQKLYTFTYLKEVVC